MTTNASHHPHPTVSILTRLHREWRALADRPAALRRADGWQLGITFRSLDDVIVAAGLRPLRSAARPVDPEAAEAVLRRLVIAARHDDLAARVVLQRLLPGVLAAARRWAHRPEGGAEALDELITATWTVIRTYPVERRPAHLAAQLLRDAEYHAFVREYRRMARPEARPPMTLDRAVPVDDTVDPRVELADLVAVARRTVLTDRDLQLLALIVRGRSAREVAAELDVSVRTVTNRREALVSRLRQAARQLEAA